MEKMSKMLMAESSARALSMVLTAAAAAILGLDAETKRVMFMERKAYIRMLPAIWVSMVVYAAAAGYQCLQLGRCLAVAWLGKDPCKGNKFWLCVCLFFDQGVTYATFVASLAAAQGELVALMGMKAMQWGKVCNLYPGFCVQAAIGVVVGLGGFLAMAVTAWFPAYRLFRLFPDGRAKSVPQGATYATFVVCLAAAQGGLVALTGVKALQWGKLCYLFPGFCVQATIGVVIALGGFLAMAVTAWFTTYCLFRLYPYVHAKSFARVGRWGFF